MFSEILFFILAGLAIVAALTMVTRRNPVSAALWLIGTFFCLAAIFTLLGAFFIGIIQILVYAGAIMVLFLFVIMLLNLGNEFEPDLRSRAWQVTAVGTGLVLLAAFARIAGGEAVAPLGRLAGPEAITTQVEEFGAVGAIAIPMYTEYMVILQVTGLLLLVAVVGAVILAKRRV